MSKERKPDLGGPDDEALEQHVREMLDLNQPEPAKSEEIPEEAKPTPTKATKISITQHDDEPATAPVVPTKSKAKKIAITEPEIAPAVDPVVSDEPDVEEPAPQEIATAPELPTTKIETTPEEHDTAVETPVIEPEDQPADTIAEDQPASDSSPLEAAIESVATEQAVDDIVATESDQLLAADDEQRARSDPSSPIIHPPKKPLLKRSGFWWTIAFLLLALPLAIGIIPSLRYTVLNSVGVRSGASLTVIDSSTQQPLKHATVSLAGEQVQTDDTGKATFSQLRLGPTTLKIEKRAFASVEQAQTIGWGSNPLTDVALKPTGSQYSFTVTDKLSGKPLGNAEASYDDANANADEKGIITLTLDKNTEGTVTVQIKAAGYRDESVELSLDSKQDIAVSMVPEHKVAFISKRAGTYDVYAIDVDGKNEKLILKGTGNEQSSLALAAHPTAEVAVLLASRAGERDADGGLLTDVTFVNLKDGQTKQLAQSSGVRAIDWLGSRFVYVMAVRNAKADDPARYKLMSYDYLSGDNRQLAAANSFNDVVSAAGKIYFAPSSAYQNGINTGVFVVDADGGSKQPVFDKESWSIIRASYDHLLFAVQQDWYEYVLGGKPVKLDGQPATTTSRYYVDSPNGKQSAWLDSRDGKITLMLYDIATKTDKTLYAKSSMANPIRWLGNQALLFRTASAAETADYVVSSNGGEPQKVVDVTDSRGVERYAY